MAGGAISLSLFCRSALFLRRLWRRKCIARSPTTAAAVAASMVPMTMLRMRLDSSDPDSSSRLMGARCRDAEDMNMDPMFKHLMACMQCLELAMDRRAAIGVLFSREERA